VKQILISRGVMENAIFRSVKQILIAPRVLENAIFRSVKQILIGRRVLENAIFRSVKQILIGRRVLERARGNYKMTSVNTSRLPAKRGLIQALHLGTFRTSKAH
jgi:aromatic ring-opening dioxygenase LigB subunit